MPTLIYRRNLYISSNRTMVIKLFEEDTMKKLVLLGVTFLLLIPFMSQALVVGLNDDVHFDYRDMQADDFHIEGTIYSAGGIAPKVTDILVFGDPGTGTWQVDSYCLMPIGPDQWKFTAHFSTNGIIVYCQWIHFGIKFDVDAFNVIADLQGWWTLGGAPLMDQGTVQSIEEENTDMYKQVAITGFDVFGSGMDKKLKITNSTNLPITIEQLELAISNDEVPLIDMFSTGLGRPGEPSPMFPILLWDKAPGFPTTLQPQAEIVIPLANMGITMIPGQFLQIRGEQYMEGSKALALINKKNSKIRTNPPDWGWFWEQHGE